MQNTIAGVGGVADRGRRPPRASQFIQPGLDKIPSAVHSSMKPIQKVLFNEDQIVGVWERPLRSERTVWWRG